MRTAHTGRLLIALALFAAGCGAGKSDEHAVASQARARAVADAWNGSPAAEAWTQGYYPLDDVIQPPEDAFHNDADKQAYAQGEFVLRTALPAVPARTGRVTWDGGGSLALPLMSARQAYDSVARGAAGGPHLTVTGAELGRTTLLTSRGPATVPAWLFTLRGYDTPLKRVALNPSRQPKAPIGPAAQNPGDPLWPLERLVEVADAGRSVTVLAGHGACDDGAAVDVLETGRSVVLSATVTGGRKGPCTSELIGQEVTVTLHRPLGERILLDAFTGRPVVTGSRG
ncbi:hypothetical protein ACYF6T_14450 [Streptomyces sp. 7R007]